MITLRPRKSPDTDIDLTPVMDVIFILLIFSSWPRPLPYADWT